jgi:hypothetical protein
MLNLTVFLCNFFLYMYRLDPDQTSLYAPRMRLPTASQYSDMGNSSSSSNNNSSSSSSIGGNPKKDRETAFSDPGALYRAAAAEMVGGYLDTVVAVSAHTSTNISAGAATGIGTEMGGASTSSKDAAQIAATLAWGDDNEGSSSRSSGGGGDNSNGTGTRGSKNEQDSYTNFVRKNLKSKGTSKKLNRTMGRVSMAKMRWQNRSAEGGGGGGGAGGGGGKWGGKYGKGKHNKFGGGGGGANDDSASGGGGSTYNQPRGLQQWGLDALTLSLDLLQQDDGIADVAAVGTSAKDAASAVAPFSVEVHGGGVAGAAMQSDRIQVDVKESDGADFIQLSDDDDDMDYSTGDEDDCCDEFGHGQKCMSQKVPTQILSSSSAAAAADAADVHAETATSRHATGASSSMGRTGIHMKIVAARTGADDQAGKAKNNSTRVASSSSRNTVRTAAEKAHDKLDAKITKRQRDNERVNAMTIHAPKCPGHSMPCKLLTVKKSGPNKVRTAVRISIIIVLFFFMQC